MKHLMLLLCLLLTACESNVETTLREQKKCKQVGEEPITNQVTISNFRGERLGSGFNVICKFKEM